MILSIFMLASTIYAEDEHTEAVPLYDQTSDLHNYESINPLLKVESYDTWKESDAGKVLVRGEKMPGKHIQIPGDKNQYRWLSSGVKQHYERYLSEMKSRIRLTDLKIAHAVADQKLKNPKADVEQYRNTWSPYIHDASVKVQHVDQVSSETSDEGAFPDIEYQNEFARGSSIGQALRSIGNVVPVPDSVKPMVELFGNAFAMFGRVFPKVESGDNGNVAVQPVGENLKSLDAAQQLEQLKKKIIVQETIVMIQHIRPKVGFIFDRVGFDLNESARLLDLINAEPSADPAAADKQIDTFTKMLSTVLDKAQALDKAKKIEFSKDDIQKLAPTKFGEDKAQATAIPAAFQFAGTDAHTPPELQKLLLGFGNNMTALLSAEFGKGFDTASQKLFTALAENNKVFTRFEVHRLAEDVLRKVVSDPGAMKFLYKEKRTMILSLLGIVIMTSILALIISFDEIDKKMASQDTGIVMIGLIFVGLLVFIHQEAIPKIHELKAEYLKGALVPLGDHDARQKRRKEKVDAMTPNQQSAFLDIFKNAIMDVGVKGKTASDVAKRYVTSSN